MPWFTLRALAAVLGAMAVFLACDTTRRFGVPIWAATAAAGFGAVAPLLVGVAPRIAPDGFSVFFAILVVWTLAWALQRPSLRRQALLGVTIGLVASAKYNGVPFHAAGAGVAGGRHQILAATGAVAPCGGWCCGAGV